MKERPIIFSGESVRAILDGKKSMTRRVVKPSISSCFDLERDGRLELMEIENKNNEMVPILSMCPYGKIGDRLWVRETFAFPRVYKADNTQESHADWKSPMFMSRLMSRITLEITDIRVERLQNITTEDAIKEGMPRPYVARDEFEPIGMYQEAWNSLNAKRGYPWESNPWVWVVSFKVVQK